MQTRVQTLPVDDTAGSASLDRGKSDNIQYIKEYIVTRDHDLGDNRLVDVRDVVHRYSKKGPVILGGVSLSIRRNEVIAIVGRSGTGKSTLLHILAGLRRPQGGAVEVGGQIVTGPSPSRLLMSQQPALFPWMTVRRNVGLGLRFTGKRAGLDDRVEQMLELVELGGYADVNVQELSGGQQQRVALARALAPAPELLLLDEPFSALDAVTRTRLQQLVRKTVKDTGLTAVIVTHDLTEAALMADRAIILSATPGLPPGEAKITLADADRIPGNAAIVRTSEHLAAKLHNLAVAEESLSSAQL